MSSSQRKTRSYETAGERRGQKQHVATRTMFRPLAFDHCALSLQPFRDPVLSKVSNAVFDITNIVPFVQQHKIDPITGEPMSLKDVVKLHFHKLESGKYGCPATFKEFTEHSHIVAILTSGYVYSMEAVKELNIRANNWTDLTTGDAFTKKDIVTLQDPSDPTRRNVNSFHHVKFNTKVTNKQQESIRTDPSMRRVLDKLNVKRGRDEEAAAAADKETDRRVVRRDDSASAGFTSAGFVGREEVVEIIPHKKTGRRGKVRLYTSHGTMEIEVFADVAPVASENFLKLCSSGYYRGCGFHRLIKGFMVQGGDPTGTGRGGESSWQKMFQDEIVPSLHHNRRGVVSMANSGPNTNRSQFFITFQSKTHLDGRHTIFGQVTGGLETLDTMEEVPVGAENAPLLPITIKDTLVMFDPFEHLEEEQAEEKREEEKKQDDQQRGEWFSNVTKSYPKPELIKPEGGVGKYKTATTGRPDRGLDFGVTVNSTRKKSNTSRDFGSAF